MQAMDMGKDMPPMTHAYSLNLPMNRNGSGTSWLPDASPMYGQMIHGQKWMYMLHGNAYLRYNNQGFTNKGSRGGSQVDVPAWLMLMGQRKIGQRNLFHFSAMLSADALSAKSGYPLLFQSGETYNGQPLVDRQHPHDFFSELAISYTHSFTEKIQIFGYWGYPGEPALGPVAFMHRPSALNNPDAPLSHHWIDATHITFGVGTLGIRLGNFKVEGSVFTGREPNEQRFNFDKPLMDSYSGRLSYNPTKNWALQISSGFIKSPEALHTEENINRTTASAIYSKAMADQSRLNITAVWGINQIKNHAGENAFLIEGAWQKQKWTLHSRYEWVQKSTEELALDEISYGEDSLFPVNAFTLGFNYDLIQMKNSRLAGGGQWSIYQSDKRLNSLYGKYPMTFEVYLRWYPKLM